MSSNVPTTVYFSAMLRLASSNATLDGCLKAQYRASVTITRDVLNAANDCAASLRYFVYNTTEFLLFFFVIPQNDAQLS